MTSTVAEITLPAKEPSRAIQPPISVSASSSEEGSDAISPSDLTNTLIGALADALDEVESNDVDQESDKLQSERRFRRQAPALPSVNGTNTDPSNNSTTTPSPTNSSSTTTPAIPTSDSPATKKTKRQTLAMLASLSGSGLSAFTSMAAIPVRAVRSFLPKREAAAGDLPSLPSGNPLESLAGNSDLPSMSSIPGVGQFANAVPGFGSMIPKMRKRRQVSSTTPSGRRSQSGNRQRSKRQALKIPSELSNGLPPTTAAPSSTTTTSAPKAKRQLPSLDDLNKPIPTTTSAPTTSSSAAPKVKRQSPLDTFTGFFGSAAKSVPALPGVPSGDSSSTTAAPKAKRQSPLDTFTGFFGTALKGAPSVPGAPTGDSTTTTLAPKVKRQSPLDTFTGFFGTALKSAPAIPGVPGAPGDASSTTAAPKAKRQSPLDTFTGFFGSAAKAVPSVPGAPSGDSSSTTAAPKAKRQSPLDTFTGFFGSAAKSVPSLPGAPATSSTTAAPKAKRQVPLDTFSGLFGNALPKGAPAVPALPSDPTATTTTAKPKSKRQAPDNLTTTPSAPPTVVELGGLEVFPAIDADETKIQKTKREVIYEIPSTYLSLNKP